MQRYESKIATDHINYISKRILKYATGSSTVDEAARNIYNSLSAIYTKAGQPLLVKRYINSVPNLDEINETIEECTADISAVNSEHINIATKMKDNFNYKQNQKNKLVNRLKALSNSIHDAMFLNNSLNEEGVIIIRDGFVTTDMIDKKKTVGVPAYVSSKEGIARLNVTASDNVSKSAVVEIVEGNGEIGGKHIAQIKHETLPDGTELLGTYTDEIGSSIGSIIDGRADTWFEYQIAGCQQADKDKMLNYDIAWASANKTGDKIRAKIIIKLKEDSNTNMITIHPFYSSGQNPRLTVVSIRESIDGISYKDITSGPVIINPVLNKTPNTYLSENDYINAVSANMGGNGVFIFKPAKTRYIEIVFEQDQSYELTLGHTYYKMAPYSDSIKNMDMTKAVRVPASQVPDEVIKGMFGRYIYSNSMGIEKGIDIITGWRYMIGIRDIGVYSFKYAQKSEMVSVKFELGKPIRKLYLEADEVIPSEFRSILEKRNEYIKYYISFDDINWIRVSPKHHMPCGKENLPPKLIEVNPISSDINANKYSYETEKPVLGFRVKIVFERPDEEKYVYYTPALEEYRVKVVCE